MQAWLDFGSRHTAMWQACTAYWMKKALLFDCLC